MNFLNSGFIALVNWFISKIYRLVDDQTIQKLYSSTYLPHKSIIGNKGHTEIKLQVLPSQYLTQFNWVDSLRIDNATSKALSFSEIQNLKVLSAAGINVHRSLILLSSVCNSSGYLYKSGFQKDLVLHFFRIPDKVSCALSIINLFDGNYYHWVNDILPWIKVYLYIVKSIPEAKLLTNNFEEGSFQLQYLSLLGVSRDQIIMKRSNYTLVNKALVPHLPYLTISQNDRWNYMHILLPNNYHWLRKMLIRSLNKGDKNIYIKRKVGSRSVKNENEVVKVLSPYNFVTLELEQLSVGDQIKYFSAAECIVAAHGAGITNIAYCKQGVKLIEFFPADRSTLTTSAFYQISRFLEIDHHYIICKSDKQEDMYVNTNVLSETLEKLNMT